MNNKVMYIITKLCQNNKNVYLCGGAVRDIFLNIEPNDYDIVTDATPKEIINLFSDKKVKTVGESFLVTLIDGIEVATYRSDKNIGPGRKNCITKTCKTINEDLLRRDFTFNAMALCPYTGDIIDPFNGRADLQNKRVKFVGDPKHRIYEDYLRMIRAARFSCLIEGFLEERTFKAIQSNKSLIKHVAPERIQIELLKTMKYRKPSIFFDILHKTELLGIILPEVETMYNHPGGKYHKETIEEHFKLTGDYLSSKDPILRFIGYLHDVGKPETYKDGSFLDHENVGAEIIERIFTRLKFSLKDTERAKNSVKFHMRSFNKDITNKSIRRMIKTFSDHNFSWKDWIKLKIADKKANLSSKDYTKNQIKEIVLKIYKSKRITKSGQFQITDLNINGNDIMRLLEIKPSPKVGKILNFLMDQVVDNPDLNIKETLEQMVTEYGKNIA